ncbi:hypothetical protein HDU76_000459 [Blyttiomyces sp. JEL0837]|nr:hypothetical protein HDU76_000459 [Blyttiomyces sp. JEL0837]
MALTQADRHHLREYFIDSISRLVDEKPDKPIKFLLDYFESVRQGENVILRDFAYVKSTPTNRLAFSGKLDAILKSRVDDQMTAIDCFHVADLICFDFPYEIMERAVEITSYFLGLGATNICHTPGKSACIDAVPVSAFQQYFKIHFLYLEFSETVERCLREAVSVFHKVNLRDGRDSATIDTQYTSDDMRALKETFVTHFCQEESKNLSAKQRWPDETLIAQSIDATFGCHRLKASSIGSALSIMYFEMLRHIYQHQQPQLVQQTQQPQTQPPQEDGNEGPTLELEVPIE